MWGEVDFLFKNLLIDSNSSNVWWLVTWIQICARRRLSWTHAVLGRVNLDVCVPVSGMKVRSLVGLSAHSAFHWWSAKCAACMLLRSDKLMSCCLLDCKRVMATWTGFYFLLGLCFAYFGLMIRKLITPHQINLKMFNLKPQGELTNCRGVLNWTASGFLVFGHFAFTVWQ